MRPRAKPCLLKPKQGFANLQITPVVYLCAFSEELEAAH